MTCIASKTIAGYVELHDISIGSTLENVCAVLAQKLKKFPGRDIITFSSLSITNLFLKNTILLIVFPTKEDCGFVPSGSVLPTCAPSHATSDKVNVVELVLTNCNGIVVASKLVLSPGLTHSSHTPSPSKPLLAKNFK